MQSNNIKSAVSVFSVPLRLILLLIYYFVVYNICHPIADIVSFSYPFYWIIRLELFRKVTGLSVKDFDILCSIGLFDPEKMNQGIFGFRKYENSSLNYTDIQPRQNSNVQKQKTIEKQENSNDNAKIDWEQILSNVCEGTIVKHKMFGAIDIPSHTVPVDA